MARAEYWCIRNRFTGQVLPAPPSGRGATHVEPVNVGDPRPPRLFPTKTAAQKALTWWLSGRATVSIKYDQTTWGGPDEYEDWHIEPAPERNPKHWGIASLTMEINDAI